MNNTQQNGYGSNPSSAFHNPQQQIAPPKRISTNLVIIIVAFTLILAIVTTVVTIMNVKRKKEFEQPPLFGDVVTEETTQEDATAPKDKTAKAETAEPTQPVTSTQPATTTQSSAPVEYVKGTSTKDGYEGAFTGLRFTPPESWVMLTQSEIKKQFGAETAREQVEMSAMSAQNQAAVHVFVEKMPLENMTLTQFKEALKESFKEADMIFNQDRGTYPLAGKIYDVMIFDLDVSGTKVVNEVYLRQEGDRVIYVFVQYAEGARDAIVPVLQAFTAY